MTNIENIVLNGYGPNINEELSSKIGLNETIVLQKIDYWIKHNKKKGINYREGKYWTFNSIKNWQQKGLSYWSVPTLVRIFKRLEDKGLLIAKCFNRKGFDRTKWYTIDYEKLSFLTGNNVEDNEKGLKSDKSECDDEYKSNEKTSNNDIKEYESKNNKLKENDLNREILNKNNFNETSKKDNSSKIYEFKSIKVNLDRNKDILKKDAEEKSLKDDLTENKKDCEEKYSGQNKIKKLISGINQNDSNDFIKMNKCNFIKMIKPLDKFDKTNTKEYTKNNTNIIKQQPESVVEKEKVENMLKDFLGFAYTEDFKNRIVKLLKEQGEDSAYLQEKINIAKNKNMSSKCGYLYAAVKNNYKEYAFNGLRKRNSFMNFEEHAFKYSDEEILEMNRRKFAV